MIKELPEKSATIDNITGLDDVLAAKAELNHVHIESDIEGLSTKLSEKASVYHNHSVSNITGLNTTLDGKADTSHNHNLSDLEEKSYNSLTDKPDLNTKVNVTDLAEVAISGDYIDLSNKPMIPDVASKADVTYVDDALASKANATHIHNVSEINSLQDILNGKANNTHNHNLANLSEKSYYSLTNRPNFAAVALSGSYNSLTDKPVSSALERVYLTNNITINNSSTFVDVFSIPVIANKKYKLFIVLPFNARATSGIKITMSGTQAYTARHETHYCTNSFASQDFTAGLTSDQSGGFVFYEKTGADVHITTSPSRPIAIKMDLFNGAFNQNINIQFAQSIATPEDTVIFGSQQYSGLYPMAYYEIMEVV